jgi:RHS repeat-associated protein
MIPLPPEQNRAIACTLLAADRQRSPLHAFTATQQQTLVFTAYGTRPPPVTPLTWLEFTGERRVSSTGHYLLGNGYRAFNPVLMRFNGSDALSPFGRGGLNSYAYCAGDPVNRVDPAGTIWNFLKPALRALRIIRPSRASVPLPLPLPPRPLPSPLSVRGSIHSPSPSPRGRTPSQPSVASGQSYSDDPLWGFVHRQLPEFAPTRNRRSASTASLVSSSSSLPGGISVDEHLHAMSLNRPFLGETSNTASIPPPSYAATVATGVTGPGEMPPPPYRSLRPNQPGPPPPYTEVDRIRRP